MAFLTLNFNTFNPVPFESDTFTYSFFGCIYYFAPIHSKKLKSKKKSTAASQASNSGASKKKEDRPRPWLTATRNTPPPATPCFRCKQTGHWAKFCEAPHPVDEVDDGPSGSNGNQGKANARG